MSILSLKLEMFTRNLGELVKSKPCLLSFFTMTKFKLEFKFSQPVPIDGAKSKGKALMKMSNCTFIYPVCGCSVFVDMNPTGVGTVADHGVL